MSLSNAQQERYARQLSLPELGAEGQQKLTNGRVLLVGAGGLGSPAALYLAAAGVGTLGIADADNVDLSNLQRQILHASPDLHRPKVDSAKETLQALNPEITIHTHHLYVTPDNIGALVSNYDFVLDCTDSFAAKLMINDACVRAGKPFSHAGIEGLQGQLMTYVPGRGPCCRCIFLEPPEAAKTPIPVMGAVAGVIGSLQAMEAIKFLAGIGDLLTGRMLCFDAKSMEFRSVQLPRRTGCICENKTQAF